MREVIARTITDLATVSAPATWALSNHDETRHAPHYGRTHTGITTPAGSYVATVQDVPLESAPARRGQGTGATGCGSRPGSGG
ncbi:hypothetical protein ABZ835_44700 [Streptomyces sp. NPDC047461]|uniref:hypothetical protein n=1 Tax=Streptomyces sp. NPDC047461 TaxID=3155619 RepID=UPI0033DBB95F